uniref:Uncharacterized protein n=1 Tax=Fagus sylvatica TaxID=28930 RepID=A0A2N9GKR6_FAGSY
MAGEKFKKLKKPIQGMAIEVEAEFNAANVEEFPKRCAWKIEMESMRRQLDVLTEQFQKYKPPPTRTRTCCSTTKKRTCEDIAIPKSWQKLWQYQQVCKEGIAIPKSWQNLWQYQQARAYGEESHKSIECKKPALQAKNKTLMTETMEEESDAANGSNIPMQQLVTTAQCSNWQQHSSTAAFQCSEGMMKGILMIEENQEDYLQEPVYDQYQEVEEVSEGILMIEEIVEQPPVYDIKVSKEEMEEKKRPASKISHTTCSREDRACDLLIEGSHCSLHTREHHYTLRPKDTTKSKPMVKIKKISQERLPGKTRLETLGAKYLACT